MDYSPALTGICKDLAHLCAEVRLRVSDKLLERLLEGNVVLLREILPSKDAILDQLLDLKGFDVFC